MQHRHNNVQHNLSQITLCGYFTITCFLMTDVLCGTSTPLRQLCPAAEYHSWQLMSLCSAPGRLMICFHAVLSDLTYVMIFNGSLFPRVPVCFIKSLRMDVALSQPEGTMCCTMFYRMCLCASSDERFLFVAAEFIDMCAVHLHVHMWSSTSQMMFLLLLFGIFKKSLAAAGLLILDSHLWYRSWNIFISIWLEKLRLAFARINKYVSFTFWTVPFGLCLCASVGTGRVFIPMCGVWCS